MKCKGPWKSRIMVYKHPEATACSMSITLSNVHESAFSVQQA